MWVQRVIYKTLSNHYRRFKLRSESLHEDGTSSRHTKAVLYQRIFGLHEYQEKLLQQDKGCFTFPLDQWKDTPIRDMRAWIYMHEHHIRQCATLAKQQMKTYTSDLRRHGFCGRSIYGG